MISALLTSIRFETPAECLQLMRSRFRVKEVDSYNHHKVIRHLGVWVGIDFYNSMDYDGYGMSPKTESACTNVGDSFVFDFPVWQDEKRFTVQATRVPDNTHIPDTRSKATKLRHWIMRHEYDPNYYQQQASIIASLVQEGPMSAEEVDGFGETSCRFCHQSYSVKGDLEDVGYCSECAVTYLEFLAAHVKRAECQKTHPTL